MRLEFCDEQFEEDMVASFPFFKFILVSKNGEEILRVFSGMREHYSAVLPGDTLIGGGFSEKKGMERIVSWGSTSCQQEFSLDRPENEDDATKILLEIQRALSGWQESVLERGED